MAGITATQEAHSTRMDELADVTRSNRAEVLHVVTNLESRVDGLYEKVGDELPEIVSDAVNTHLAQFGMDSGSAGPSRSSSSSGVKEETYLQARRSLQVWPIDQPNDAGFNEFCRKYLAITPEECSGFKVIRIVPVQQSKLPNECLVEFQTCLLYTSPSPRD